MKKCIVAFAAHTADAELGAGGTIAKFVRQGYRALADGDRGRWVTLDATQPPDALAELAWERLSAVLLTSPSAKLQR